MRRRIEMMGWMASHWHRRLAGNAMTHTALLISFYSTTNKSKMPYDHPFLLLTWKQMSHDPIPTPLAGIQLLPRETMVGSQFRSQFETSLTSMALKMCSLPPHTQEACFGPSNCRFYKVTFLGSCHPLANSYVQFWITLRRGTCTAVCRHTDVRCWTITVNLWKSHFCA